MDEHFQCTGVVSFPPWESLQDGGLSFFFFHSCNDGLFIVASASDYRIKFSLGCSIILNVSTCVSHVFVMFFSNT